jgi:hypothetical protein
MELSSTFPLLSKLLDFACGIPELHLLQQVLCDVSKEVDALKDYINSDEIGNCEQSCLVIEVIFLTA